MLFGFRLGVGWLVRREGGGVAHVGMEVGLEGRSDWVVSVGVVGRGVGLRRQELRRIPCRRVSVAIGLLAWLAGLAGLLAESMPVVIGVRVVVSPRVVKIATALLIAVLLEVLLLRVRILALTLVPFLALGALVVTLVHFRLALAAGTVLLAAEPGRQLRDLADAKAYLCLCDLVFGGDGEDLSLQVVELGLEVVGLGEEEVVEGEPRELLVPEGGDHFAE